MKGGRTLSGNPCGTTAYAQADPPRSMGLNAISLGRLMPLHIVLDHNAFIRGVGPTLAKVLDGQSPIERSFFDLFEVSRPKKSSSVADLLRAQGGRISLIGVEGPGDHFRAVAVPTCDGGALLNLSFGTSLLDAVRDHRLTAGDFAETDLAVEMLFLMEAKSAAMNELRNLNSRLRAEKSNAEIRAITDTLTGVGNRRVLDEKLERLLSTDSAFALMHLDVDHFKRVNDTYGHAAGDAVLRLVSEILTSETRKGDSIVRAGGDEFILLFPSVTDAETARELGNRIIDRLSRNPSLPKMELPVSASIGVVIRSSAAKFESDEILEMGDAALYRAKKEGRGQVRVYG